jgi:hypothetical protein
MTRVGGAYGQSWGAAGLTQGAATATDSLDSCTVHPGIQAPTGGQAPAASSPVAVESVCASSSQLLKLVVQVRCCGADRSVSGICWCYA